MITLLLTQNDAKSRLADTSNDSGVLVCWAYSCHIFVNLLVACFDVALTRRTDTSSLWTSIAVRTTASDSDCSNLHSK